MASKVQTLQQRAQQAYDAEDRAWFDSLPETDLGVLWGIACSEGAAYDDEVYDALAQRGWFDDDHDLGTHPDYQTDPKGD